MGERWEGEQEEKRQRRNYMEGAGTNIYTQERGIWGDRERVNEEERER